MHQSDSYHTHSLTLAITLGLFLQSTLIQGAEITPNERLIKAAYFGSIDQTIKALDDGADINATNQGANALAIAWANNHFELAKLLIDSGSDIISQPHTIMDHIMPTFDALGVLIRMASAEIYRYTQQHPTLHEQDLADFSAYNVLSKLIETKKCTAQTRFWINEGMAVPPQGVDISNLAVDFSPYDLIEAIAHRIDDTVHRHLCTLLQESGNHITTMNVKHILHAKKFRLLLHLAHVGMPIHEIPCDRIPHMNDLHRHPERLPNYAPQLKQFALYRLTSQPKHLKLFFSDNALIQGILDRRPRQFFEQVITHDLPLMADMARKRVLNEALAFAVMRTEPSYLLSLIAMLMRAGAHPSVIISAALPLTVIEVLMIHDTLSQTDSMAHEHKKALIITMMIARKNNLEAAMLQQAELSGAPHPAAPYDILQKIFEMEAPTRHPYPQWLINHIFTTERIPNS